MTRFYPNYGLRENITSITCNVNNTTGSIPIWTGSGPIIICQLYGVVTTAISTNHTAGGFRVTSGGGATNLTTLAGVLSSAGIGSFIGKLGAASSAPTVQLASVSSVSTNVNEFGFSSVVVGPITGQTAIGIEYRYTTTDAPSSGVIEMHCIWTPLLPGSTLV